MALVLANGAYVHRAKLSRPVGTAAELRGKLEGIGFEVVGADDQDLTGMRDATKRWLRLVQAVVDEAEDETPPPMVTLLFVYCGHGRSGSFLPVDITKAASPDDMFCFFEDFLFRLYHLLSEQGRYGDEWASARRRRLANGGLPVGEDRWVWRPVTVRLVSIIESCRRLSQEEQKAFDAQRMQQVKNRRHLLPGLAAFRPESGPMCGADWDAARLGFLAQLGPGCPELLLALSSESSTPSYDVVFLRSITEAIDRPVRLGGILERASLDTLRRTGHKQNPVLLALGYAPSGSPNAAPPLAETVLALARSHTYSTRRDRGAQVSVSHRTLSRSASVPFPAVRRRGTDGGTAVSTSAENDGEGGRGERECLGSGAADVASARSAASRSRQLHARGSLLITSKRRECSHGRAASAARLPNLVA